MKPLAVMPVYLPVGDNVDVVKLAIRSLLGTADVDLLVLDDASPDQEAAEQVLEYARERGAETVELPENRGFSTTVNIGLKTALDTGRDALLVNSDIQFMDNGWLGFMQNAPADVVGARLLYPNGTIQHAGIFYSVLGRGFWHRFMCAPHNLDAALEPVQVPVTGALQLIRHDCLQEVGIYDEGFKLGWEDVDYCARTFMAGRVCYYEPKAVAYHHEALFRGAIASERVKLMLEDSWAYFLEKHAVTDALNYFPTMLVDNV